MAVGGATTVGPITEETRDELARYRDERGFPNYETAVRSLLKNATER